MNLPGMSCVAAQSRQRTVLDVLRHDATDDGGCAADQSSGLRVRELHPYVAAGLGFARMRVRTRRNRQSELRNRLNPSGTLPR
jgi:hypothetical protein